ncbi:MAG: efflux RND transporter permease subunit [Gammaproteobacteria bacterium]|nr:efflux RND transporter permease subunit [Gammaproteobacteria bacterium]
MKFTDIFIKRPVLAVVLSLFVLLLGLRSIEQIQIRQFPKVEQTVISVSTAYPGASAELMQGFITQPLAQAIAASQGIEYMTSSSGQGSSTITANIVLNYDPTKALTDITAAVNQVRNQLPPQSESPVITKSTGGFTALMYLAFYSEQMDGAQIADYLARVVVPKLQTVQGVAQARILGSSFAMRIWLDPDKLAAHHITPEQVAAAIQANNFIAAVGSTKGPYVSINVNARTDLHTAEEFENLVVASDDNGTNLIRIRDLGHVDLGAESYDVQFFFGGKEAVAIAVQPTPSANPLDVADGIKKVFPEVQDELPTGMNATIAYDGSEFIHSAINEVITTLLEAGVIVIIVIFLFLGAIRTALIPAVTMPLSLVGAVFVMVLLGYSLNLLTLLAMVLAIGLVVDDAIIVVENIYRHMEQGMSRFKAALQGAREIGSPIIAMSITLAAVYAPIGFQGGLTGALFKEFAFTLAVTVLISGFLALTLSPMMCSKVLRPPQEAGRFAVWLDKFFERFKNGYQHLLHNSLNYRPATIVVGLTVLVSLFFLYSMSQKELAPPEDQGFVIAFGNAPPTATLDFQKLYAEQLQKQLMAIPQRENVFLITGMGGSNTLGGLILKPWGERDKSAAQIKNQLSVTTHSIAGLQIYVVLPPSLPIGGGGTPVQFVLSTTADYTELHDVTEQIVRNAQTSGLFFFVDQSLKFDQPQLEITVDRDKALSMGLSMADIGRAMGTLLGGGYVNRFSAEGRAYKVIPQVIRKYRFDKQDLTHYYVQAQNGDMVPLGAVIDIEQTAVPQSLTQFNQLNSTTISGALRPGVSLGDALAYLQAQAEKVTPKGYFINYEGESRQYIQEGSALILVFFFALIVIYLILSALFESFRDPLIILVSVPMAIFGALLFLFVGVASINIYTQVGLVTLIGLITKHGILIVRFANEIQRDEGLSKREAVEKAAAIRLRPILMTTAAMVVGVLPLLIASGAGASARFSIGLVIATGMGIGTMFTLFVVPMVYTFVAGRHAPANEE